MVLKTIFVFSFGLSLVLASNLTTQEIINSNNLFTTSIYKELLKENHENFMVSPFSIETILSLVQSGAKNETGEEIRSALHLPDDQDKIKKAFKSLTQSLESDDYYKLHTANKMYLQHKFEVKEDFEKIATEIYKSGSENLNFGEPEEAARVINKWVEEQTQENIKNLVIPLDIHPLTVAILVNALHFKANFTDPFNTFLTEKKNFFVGGSDDNLTLVDTMQSQGFYLYNEDSELDAKMLKLFFDGDDAALVIVLPNEKQGLKNLENHLEKVFTQDNFTSEYVDVKIPKFKIESKFLLKPFLKNLGMKLAFTEDEADFSGIAGSPGDIYINTVIQKTFIAVDENGVEAAAATYVDLVTRSGSGPEITKDPILFNADHPFLFYITIKDIVMFAGRVVRP